MTQIHVEPELAEQGLIVCALEVTPAEPDIEDGRRTVVSRTKRWRS
jgi:hypothetical protein